MEHNNDKVDTEIRNKSEFIEIPQELEPEQIAVMLKENAVCEKAPKRKIVFRIAAMAALFAFVAGGAALAGNLGNREGLLNGSSVTQSSVLSGTGEAPLHPQSGAIEEARDKVGYHDVYNTIDKANTKLNNVKKDGFSIFDWLFGKKSSDQAKDFDSFTGDAASAVDAGEPSGESQRNESDNSSKDYSETLKQVEGVDEADIVKTNGSDIFFCDISNLTVYRFSVENGIYTDKEVIDTCVDSDMKYSWLDNYEEMYLCGNNLVLIRDKGYQTDESGRYNIVWQTICTIYDISGETKLISEYSQDGSYVDSRMTDGILYLVSSDSSHTLAGIDEDKKETYIPEISVNGNNEFIPADCVIVNDCITELNYFVVAGIDITAAESPVSVMAVAGSSNVVYCSAESLYTVSMEYDYETWESRSKVTRLSLDRGQIAVAASVDLNGNVINQYSMDEYDGSFRVATTFINDDYFNENGIYIYDLELNLIGELEGLGVYETIRSVRFMGTSGYIVTFKQTDPLYSLDLSDKTNPKVLDEYKTSGFGTFMYQFGDGLLLSFGVEATDEGFTTGIKVTMYDNSDPTNLKPIDTFVLENQNYYYDSIGGSWYSSVAVGDQKALMIDSEKGLVGFPIQVWRDEFNHDGEYSSYSVERYYILKWDNGEFASSEYFEIDTLDYIEKLYAANPDSPANAYCVNLNRGVRIGDYVYIFGSAFTASISVSTSDIVDEEYLMLADCDDTSYYYDDVIIYD